MHHSRRGRGRQEASTVRLLLFLGQQLSRMERWPPVTLGLAAGMVALFLEPEALDFVPPLSQACLLPRKIVEGLEIERLLFSAFVHADEMHVGYNMSSFLWKGSQLEPVMGSAHFALLLAELLAASQVLTVLLAWLVTAAAPALDAVYSRSCAVGFSGVLFGLKVVLNAHTPDTVRVAGYHVPAKYAYWAELALVQLVTPRASFMGHLGGICAGLLHVYLIEPLVAAWRPFLVPHVNWPAAFGGQPHFAAAGNRRSAGNPFQQRVRRPTWRQVRRWGWPAITLTLAAVLVATNPDEQRFEELVESSAAKGLGQNAGWVAATALWVRKRFGASLTRHNLYLFSIGRYGSLYAVGILGTWIPLPVGLIAGAWHHLNPLVTAEGIPLPVLAILAANAAIHCVWLLAERGVVPASWPVRHLEVSAPALSSRPWCALLAPFSHQRTGHMVLNSLHMLTHTYAARQVGIDLSMLIYVVTGVAAHVLNLLLHQIGPLRQPTRAGRVLVNSKGASPSIMGLAAYIAVVLARSSTASDFYSFSGFLLLKRGMHLGLAYWWAVGNVTTLVLTIIRHNKLDTRKRALPSALGGCLGLLMGLFQPEFVALAPKTP